MLRRLSAAFAFATPVVLLLARLLLTPLAARFWQFTLLLYLPRVVFGAPIALAVLLLLRFRLWRLLWTQLLALALLVFSLMGFVVSLPAKVHDPRRTLRILTYNGNFGALQQKLAQQILELNPDVVVFQQLVNVTELNPILASRYPTVRVDGEFEIASRFPLGDTVLPDRIPLAGRLRSPRFIRYELVTKFGAIALYSVHPISPRFQLRIVRHSLRHPFSPNGVFSSHPSDEVASDTELRSLELAAAVRAANAERRPVILAGDTNLPTLSPELELLAGYEEGFTQVGFGFGYTFPNPLPWMRIDRIYAAKGFHFRSFEVGSSDASDHRCVVADLELDADAFRVSSNE